MILTVTLNAAVDVTYLVDRLEPNASHAVEGVRARAGGKGVNVARVLRELGIPTAVTGLAGGATGEQLRADLRVSGLTDRLVPVGGESRRTVTVVSGEDGDATVFNEPGPTVRSEEWAAFTARFRQLAEAATVVVLSGSLPPGLPSDAYARLLRLAAAADCRTVLDASGPALRDGLAAGPDIVKPNAAELRELTGVRDPVLAADDLRTMGARSVVASLGPGGLYAATASASWRAIPPERLAGNPTGAGDACVAALAVGLLTDAPWAETVREAVALSAAAVVHPVAGGFDPATYQRLRDAVLVEETPRPAVGGPRG